MTHDLPKMFVWGQVAEEYRASTILFESEQKSVCTQRHNRTRQGI